MTRIPYPTRDIIRREASRGKKKIKNKNKKKKLVEQISENNLTTVKINRKEIMAVGQNMS